MWEKFFPARAAREWRVSSRDVNAQPITAEELRQTIDGLPVAVYVCETPGGAIRFYNRRAAELWGRAPKLGDTAERFCGSLRLYRADGRPLPHDETPMAEALRDGAPRSGEVVIERPDGSRVAVRVDIAPLRDAAGRVVGALNAFQDVGDRKAAEIALRLSEARYRAIVEDQPEMVCRFRPDGTLTFVNEAYCAFFGVDRAAVIGTPYAPAVHPDDVAMVRERLAALGGSNRVAVIENRVVGRDGAVRWTEWTNHAVCDEHGRVLEFQATGRDVSERRKAEDAAAHLAALVASADDAILSKTLDGVITSWNAAAERLFGYAASEVIGRPITTIIPPDRLDEETDILARLARGEALEHFDTFRVTRDGRRLPVSLSISPIRDSRGRIIGASTIARDVSDRQRVETELRAKVQTLEALYRLTDAVGRARDRRALCEAAVEAIVAMAGAHRASVLLFDDAGVMRFVASRGLSGGYRAAVEGHSPWSRDTRDPLPILVEDVLEEPALAGLRDVIASEGIRALGFVPLVSGSGLIGKFMIYHDVPHRFSQEELRLVATVAHHVASGLGRLEAEAAVEDLLRRERAARLEADAARGEAERTNRAKDEFLAMLAHELRNPLSVIVNAIAVINRGAVLPPPSRRAGAMLERQAEHLARLLDDLLDVARITSGRIELELERADLGPVVRYAVEAQRHRLDAKRQHLALALPEGPLTVLGDPVRLQQVVGNLVNNASKYTPSGGSIWVALEGEADRAVLRVRDDGVGIPADKLESIFELFAQANDTLARTEGGLGIGLTLVRRVVELHGGTVQARSEGAGRGAEFVVTLPLAAPAPRAIGPAPASGAGKTLRIGIVEDHDDGREMLAMALRLNGHQVVEAATGETGVQMALERPLDVVLIDIGLPDVPGYDVARRLRSVLGDAVRLIALTGYGQPQDHARSSAAGFDAHLVKPVDPARLADVLQQLVPAG